MPVYIAKHKKTHLHYFFRIFRVTDVPNVSDLDLTSFLNRLMSAKGHKQIAGIVEKSALLYNVNKMSNGMKQVLTPRRCIALLGSRFEPTDAKLLAEEMYLYSPTPRRANSSSKSPAASLDAFANDLPSILKELDEESVVLIESVQDWMMFRNSISVCAVLLSTVERHTEAEGSIESAGFNVRPGIERGQSIAMVPLKYAASQIRFFADWDNLVHARPIRYGSELSFFDDLYRCYADGNILTPPTLATRGIPFFAGLKRRQEQAWRQERMSSPHSDNSVFFSLPYEALVDDSSPLLRNIPDRLQRYQEAKSYLESIFDSDRNIYLCATVDSSENDIDVAKKILRVFWGTTQTLRHGNTPLGATPDLDRLFEPQLTTMPMAFPSLISKSWNALFYRGGARLATCKRCGCAIISSSKGPLKEYCSDSCRIQDRS